MNSRFTDFCNDDDNMGKVTCGILCAVLLYLIYATWVKKEGLDNAAVSQGPLQDNGVATASTAMSMMRLPGTPLGIGTASVMACQQGLDQLWGSGSASCGKSDDQLYNILLEEGNTGFRQTFGRRGAAQ